VVCFINGLIAFYGSNPSFNDGSILSGYVWLKNGRQNVRYAMRESLMEEAIKRGLAEIRFDVEVTAELF